jgi:hypothetical protein
LPLYLWRHANVLILMDQIVHRMCGVVLHLEYRDHALPEIAVVIEADLALGNCSTALEDRGAAENCINRLIGVGAMSRGCADN